MSDLKNFKITEFDCKCGCKQNDMQEVMLDRWDELAKSELEDENRHIELESLDRGEPVDHEQTQRLLNLLRSTPRLPDNSDKVIIDGYVKKF